LLRVVGAGGEKPPATRLDVFPFTDKTTKIIIVNLFAYTLKRDFRK